MKKTASISFLPLLLSGLLLCASRAEACVVPVFRYALERWPADYYPVLVFYRKELPAAMKPLADELAALAEKKRSNIHVTLQDVEKIEDPQIKAVWEQEEKAGAQADSAWVTCLFPPESQIAAPAFSGPLSQFDPKSVSESPARSKVAAQIKKGHSAVFVFLKSGDAAKDKKARAFLEKKLRFAEKTLKLPEINDENRPGWFHEEAGPKLRMSFAIVDLSRRDPAEAFFVRLLEKAFPADAVASKGPVAVPIFGQGRALEAMSGEGLSEDRIVHACSFMSGSCSCEIKDLNPGVDMLVSTDWGDFRKNTPVAAEEPEPVLLGFSDFLAGDSLNKEREKKSAKSAPRVDQAVTEKKGTAGEDDAEEIAAGPAPSTATAAAILPPSAPPQNPALAEAGKAPETAPALAPETERPQQAGAGLFPSQLSRNLSFVAALLLALVLGGLFYRLKGAKAK